ncbi:MAG: MFS transporter [Chloroflexi bacterium]|nr:MFS transporter [Chloroflexota bacterium]
MENSKAGLSVNQEKAVLGIPFRWVIVILGFIILILSNLNVNTFGIFFKPTADQFGWSRGMVSGAYSLRALLMAALVVPMGYLSDRYGPRWVLVACCLFSGTAFVLIGRAASLWQYYLAQGVLMGIGNSGLFVCVAATVGRWHDARRGLALGIMSTGTGISSIVFPLVAANLIQSLGWHWAIAILGAITLAVGIPVSLLFKNPEERGGRTVRKSGPYSPFEAWRLVPKLLQDPVLIAIVLMLFFFYTAGNLFTSQFVNYVTDTGISALVAATMMSAMGVASATGRLGLGSVSDRIGTKADNVVCCALVAVAFIILPFTHISATMWLAAIAFGVGFGGMAPLIPSLVLERFGTERVAALTGVAMMGNFLGSVAGPWMGGFIFDVFESYLLAFVLSTVFTITALIIALRLPSATNMGSEHRREPKGKDYLSRPLWRPRK